MSKKCIKIGDCNSFIIYLILSILFSLLLDIALGSANVVVFKYFKALDSGNLSKCFLVRNIFCYLLTIIMAHIFSIIEKKNLSGKQIVQTEIKKDDDNINKKLSGNIPLIHNEKEDITDLYPNIKLLFIIFSWVLEEQLLAYFKDMIFLHIDFWMIELIIIHFFLVKYFKIEVYDHQKLILWFFIFPLMLKLATIILSYCDPFNRKRNSISGENKYEYKYNRRVDTSKLIYVAIDWLIGLALPIYFILITCRSYVYTKIKWIMDKKCISPNKILFFYGIIGASFCFIVNIISSFIPCDVIDKDKYRLSDYFCKVEYENEIYVDNIRAYFTGLNEMNFDSIIEIIALFLGVIFFFLHKYFSLKVIQVMTPVHLIMSYPIYYIFNKIYLLILNKIKSQGYLLLNVNFAEIKLILDFIGDIISIFGYLIYLEIIELHFCDFAYNIRVSILARGNLEIEDDVIGSIKTRSDYDGEQKSIASSEENKNDNEKDFSIES